MFASRLAGAAGAIAVSSAVAGIAFAPEPCEAAITVTSIGYGTINTNTSVTSVSTTADCAAGSELIVYGVITTATRFLSQVSDTRGNTYNSTTLFADTILGAKVLYAENIADVPANTVITFTWSVASAQDKSVGLACVTGLKSSGSKDAEGTPVTNTGGNGSGVAPSSTVNATATSGHEVAFGLFGWNIISGTITGAGGTGWVGLGMPTNIYLNGTAAGSIGWAYKLVTAPGGTITYAPTLSASETYNMKAITFFGSDAGSSAGQNKLLLGVGS